LRLGHNQEESCWQYANRGQQDQARTQAHSLRVTLSCNSPMFHSFNMQSKQKFAASCAPQSGR
jgi:hypothetical protein